jgi:hypothetical protein
VVVTHTGRIVIASLEEHIAAVLGVSALREILAAADDQTVEVEDLEIWLILLGRTGAETYPWTLDALPRRASTLRAALHRWACSGRTTAAAARALLATNWPGEIDRGESSALSVPSHRHAAEAT